MLKFKLLLIFVLLSTITILSQTKIPPDSAAKYIDQKITITGIVDQVHKTDTGTYFLNMGGKYPDNTFTAVIFKSNAEDFGNINKYEGKEVAITGKVTLYKGGPEIIIKDPDQIKIIQSSKK